MELDFATDDYESHGERTKALDGPIARLNESTSLQSLAPSGGTEQCVDFGDANIAKTLQ